MFNLTQALLHDSLSLHGDRVAIQTDTRALSYRQLADRVARACALFLSGGLQRGERVLMVLPDSPELAIGWLGAVAAGGVVCAVSADARAEELAYALRYATPRVVLAPEELRPTVAAAAPQARFIPVEGFEALLEATEPSAECAATQPDEPCCWLFTSGSTGFPKAAVHRHRDFWFSIRQYAPLLGLSPGELGLSAPKLAFGYALGTNLLFPLAAGATAFLFPERCTPQGLLERIARHRPAVLTSVPSALRALLDLMDAAEAPGADLSSLRLCLSAGEPLPLALHERWLKRTGVELLDGIGSAEMFHIFISNRRGEVVPGSLGTVVEGYQAKVCDEHGQELPDGEVGTLWIRGGSRAVEYWQRPEATRATFRGEWCVSADRFRRDAAGRFWYCGRADDLFKVNGKWLAPLEVESALLTHPAVSEVVVVPYEEPGGLLKPQAFVVARGGLPTPEASTGLIEALQAHVRARLAPYKAPRRVVFVEALPRSERGKVMRARLRAEANP
jgi:benzoate-CoA ligase family protein